MSRFLASAAVLAGLAGLLGTPRGVAAHALHPALLDLSEDADGTTSVTWKTSVAQIPGVVLAPRLPASCAVIKPPVRTSDELALVERSVVRCGPGGLVGSEIGIAGLGESKTDALLRVRLVDGRLVQAVLRPDASRYVVPAKPSRLDVLRDYGRLGVSHILTGPDHLLFVLGLLLLAASPAMLLRTITAFTIGHSITLTLAALGLARVPQAPIEIAIAASVFFLAVELAGPGGTRAGLVRRLPWLVAGGFGLLHGLGFAGALAEVGLPAGEIPPALLAFNLGIESGQLLFVAFVLLVDALVRLVVGTRPARIERDAAYAIGSLAALWCMERTAALLGL